MLHKLALAANAETPSLIKEALPTPEQDAAIRKMLEKKEMEFARLRGVSVPLKERMIWDETAKEMASEMAPDTENLRLSRQTPGHVPASNTVGPGGHSALAEKEIQKQHGIVSNSKLKQFRHKYVGGAQRFWGGKGFTGNKWGNRAGLAAGATAIGLGVKAYLDSNKTPQPTSRPTPPPAPKPQYQQPQQFKQQLRQEIARRGPQNQYYPGQQDYYSKMGSDKYSPDAVTIPSPTPQPKVPALGPGVGSAPKIPGGAGKGSLGTASGGGMSGSSAGGGMSGSSAGGGGASKQAADKGVPLLLGTAAGGAGGWALGEKVIRPLVENQEKALMEEIARKQSTLNNLGKVRKAAPMGAAAAGALLLAALTALYIRRDKGTPNGRPLQRVSPYDSTGAGFEPQGYNPYGQFYG